VNGALQCLLTGITASSQAVFQRMKLVIIVWYEVRTVRCMWTHNIHPTSLMVFVVCTIVWPGKIFRHFSYQTNLTLLCWYFHLVVVEELEYPNKPESYAVSSVATGRVTLGRQVEG
jgi:hypothetical protein